MTGGWIKFVAMKIIKAISGRILAAWAAILFIVTLLPVAFIIWITGICKEPLRTKMLIKIFHVWMSIYLFFTGCRLKIKGLENFKKDETYIIICNHNSLADIIVTTPFIPGANKTIAKIELAKVPLFGMIYKRGSVLVDRKDKNSRTNSFVQMKEVLSLGIHMCIYPEGTRNKTNMPMKEFHSGAFRLAVETKTPIMPAVIFNTKKVFPPNKKFFFSPAALEVHFLPVHTVAENDSYEALKNNMYDLMSKYYVEHQRPL